MKRLNWEALLTIICLLAFSLLLAVLLITGQMRYYVHPRLNPYLWVAAALLVVMAGFMLPLVAKPRRSVRIVPFLALALPVLTAFALPPVTVGQAAAPLLGSGNPAVRSAAPISQPSSSAVAATPQPIAPTFTPAPRDEQLDQSPFTGEGITVVQDEDFLQWYIDGYDRIESLAGMVFSIRAQVTRIDGFAENEFLPGRLYMSCCAADIAPMGFLAQWDQADTLAEGSWVWVLGTLEWGEYQGEGMPVMQVQQVQTAQPPLDPYIY